MKALALGKEIARRLGVWWTGDPLYGFVWSREYMMHNGGKVPKYLFQDKAGTIPATKEGDPVAFWGDSMGGPPIIGDAVLRFGNNGVPAVSLE